MSEFGPDLEYIAAGGSRTAVLDTLEDADGLGVPAVDENAEDVNSGEAERKRLDALYAEANLIDNVEGKRLRELLDFLRTERKISEDDFSDDLKFFAGALKAGGPWVDLLILDQQELLNGQGFDNDVKAAAAIIKFRLSRVIGDAEQLLRGEKKVEVPLPPETQKQLEDITQLIAPLKDKDLTRNLQKIKKDGQGEVLDKWDSLLFHSKGDTEQAERMFAEYMQALKDEAQLALRNESAQRGIFKSKFNAAGGIRGGEYGPMLPLPEDPIETAKRYGELLTRTAELRKLVNWQSDNMAAISEQLDDGEKATWQAGLGDWEDQFGSAIDDDTFAQNLYKKYTDSGIDSDEAWAEVVENINTHRQSLEAFKKRIEANVANKKEQEETENIVAELSKKVRNLRIAVEWNLANSQIVSGFKDGAKSWTKDLNELSGRLNNFTTDRQMAESLYLAQAKIYRPTASSMVEGQINEWIRQMEVLKNQILVEVERKKRENIPVQVTQLVASLHQRTVELLSPAQYPAELFALTTISGLPTLEGLQELRTDTSPGNKARLQQLYDAAVSRGLNGADAWEDVRVKMENGLTDLTEVKRKLDEYIRQQAAAADPEAERSNGRRPERGEISNDREQIPPELTSLFHDARWVLQRVIDYYPVDLPNEVRDRYHLPLRGELQAKMDDLKGDAAVILKQRFDTSPGATPAEKWQSGLDKFKEESRKYFVLEPLLASLNKEYRLDKNPNEPQVDSVRLEKAEIAPTTLVGLAVEYRSLVNWVGKHYPADVAMDTQLQRELPTDLTREWVNGRKAEVAGFDTNEAWLQKLYVDEIKPAAGTSKNFEDWQKVERKVRQEYGKLMIAENALREWHKRTVQSGARETQPWVDRSLKPDRALAAVESYYESSTKQVPFMAEQWLTTKKLIKDPADREKLQLVRTPEGVNRYLEERAAYHRGDWKDSRGNAVQRNRYKNFDELGARTEAVKDLNRMMAEIETHIGWQKTRKLSKGLHNDPELLRQQVESVKAQGGVKSAFGVESFRWDRAATDEPANTPKNASDYRNELAEIVGRQQTESILEKSWYGKPEQKQPWFSSVEQVRDYYAHTIEAPGKAIRKKKMAELEAERLRKSKTLRNRLKRQVGKIVPTRQSQPYNYENQALRPEDV